MIQSATDWLSAWEVDRLPGRECPCGDVVSFAGGATGRLEAAVKARMIELRDRVLAGKRARVKPGAKRAAVVAALAEVMGDAAAGGLASLCQDLGLDGAEVVDHVGQATRQPDTTSMAAKRRRPGVSVADRKRLARYVRPVMERASLDVVGRFEDDFRASADSLLRQLAKDGASKADSKTAILELADRYGVTGFRGAWAETWYQTYALNSATNAGALLAYSVPGNRNLFPYLEFETRRDERVREAHAQLDGFVMPSDWAGVLRFLPPLGWNCRCRLRPIGHAEAKRLLAAAPAIGGTKRFPRSLQQVKMVGGKIPGVDRRFRPAVQWPEALNPFTRTG